MARIPTANYVAHYDGDKAHHRAWLQAALNRLDELDPEALQRDSELYSIWSAAVPSKPAHPYGVIEPLLALIRQGESSGNYEAANTGSVGGRPWQGLSAMTLSEVLDAQAKGRLFAAGAYQITPEPMKQLVARAGLPLTAPFSQAAQDWLAVVLILGGWKRPKLTSYLLGKGATLAQAHEDVAYEWASLQGPAGKGMYDGDSAGNHAGIPAAKISAALEAGRAAIAGRSIEQLGLRPPAVAAPKLKPSSPFSAKITPHIALGEFALYQEARRFKYQYQLDVATELAVFMERCRAHFGGKPVIITSGYRPPAVNKAVGGAENSEHLYNAANIGAVDFFIDGVAVKAVQDWCDKEWPYSLGYGAPKGFVHLGMRAGRPRVRWDY